MTARSASQTPALAAMMPVSSTVTEVRSGRVSSASHLLATVVLAVVLVSWPGLKGEPGHQTEARQSVRGATRVVLQKVASEGS